MTDIKEEIMDAFLEEMKKLNINLYTIADTIDHIPHGDKCCDVEPEEKKEREVEEYTIRLSIFTETDNPLKMTGEIIDHLTETYGEETKVRDLTIYTYKAIQ